MTAMPGELARKQPAQVVPVAAAPPRVINGHVVRKDTGARIATGFVLLILAVLFAGYLLSSL